VTNDSVKAYTYDSNGNTLTKTDSTGTTSYAWDFENRLTSVTLPGSGGTVSFKYDPFGRRIYKSSPSGTSVFSYDGDNMVEETNSSGAVVARYTQTLNIDEPLSMLRSGATSYYHSDGLGSITSLSSAAGSSANTYTYDSFGKLTNSTGTLVNPFRYTAREFDTETNLYFYRARYYDPSMGRFLAEDPIGFDGGQNFYAYVRNNPISYADPSGLITCEEKIRTMLNKLINSVRLDCSDKPVFEKPGTYVGQEGGHKKYEEVSNPLSPQDYERVLRVLTNSENKGFRPGYRIGGPFNDLHLINPGAGTQSGTIDVTAHIDIGNPNNGLLGMITHGIVDGLGGHIVDFLFKKNRSIDVDCTE